MSDAEQSTVDFDGGDDSALNGSSDGRKLSLGKMILLILLAALVLGGGAYAAYLYVKDRFSFNNDGQTSKQQRKWTAAPDGIGRFQAPPPPDPPSPATPEIKTEVPPETPPSLPDLTPPPLEQTVPMEDGSQETLQSRRLKSGVRTYTAREKPAEAPPPARQVKVMKNIDYTLIKGTKIPCTLETNIVSEQQGFTSCVINQDVYSGNARILLIEKGSRVTGEYLGEIKNGERRLQIVWDRLITPHDVAVQIDSPVTDRLGASGVTGKVDNRWGTRIGSALLISLVGDSLGVLAGNSKTADVIVESETSNTSQDLAKRILENNIDLPPVIYIREGEMINIYVADDIDLSGVYRVVADKPQGRNHGKR